MSPVIDFLVHQVKTNQFMSAALVAAPASMLMYAAREIPGKIWNSVKLLVSTELRFNSDTESYHKIQQFVTENLVSTRLSRQFKYHGENKYDYDLSRAVWSSTLSVGYGTHYGSWKGKPVMVKRELSEANQSSEFKEDMKITFLGRGMGRLEQFITDLEIFVHKKTEEPSILLYVNDDDSWERMASVPIRPMSTVFTSEGQKETALAHMLKFHDKKKWYRDRGLPYHTGILLYGKPGTGKSSLIVALAGATERDVYYLNLAALTKESALTSLLASRGSWANAILVVEDIDVSGAAVTREEDSGGKITLSTLLNTLDGIISPDGLIVIATTNHIESLDEALIRAGRFDLSLELDYLQVDQFCELCELFEVPVEVREAIRADYVPTTGAVLRGLMLSEDYTGLKAHFGV